MNACILSDDPEVSDEA